ncbi:MAG: hypothetical protein SGI73_12440 [Chloroflexota bacterium]|nr:hypothetical protein [Chloroflexota bacterium]
MIETLRRLLLNVRYPYRTQFDRERAVGILSINLLLIAAWLASIFLNTIPSLLQPAPNFLSIVFGLSFIIPLVGLYVLVQLGRIEAAVRVLILMTLAVIYPVLSSYEPPVIPVLLVLPLTAGAAFLRRRQQVLLALFVIAVLGVRVYLQSDYPRTVRLTPSDEVAQDIVLLGSAIGVSAAFLLVSSGANLRLIERTGRTTALLRSVGSYRALVAGIYDDDRIFIRSLELLQIDLRYTLASAYRLNEGGTYTRLQLGGIGQDVVSRSEIRLNEDSSAVGEAARRSQPVIANAFDSGILGSHILPPARWSISLSVMRNGVLLGLIDIQTEHAEGFGDDEREAFGILVDQIAGALVEAGDFRELRRINREQEELLLRYRGQIVQTEQRGQQMFVSAWDRYVQGRTATGEATGFGFDLAQTERDGATLTPASDLPPDILAALAAGDVHIERAADVQIVRAPVVFRNQTLGALSFRVPKDRLLNDRQLELLRTVATRLGVALENNRLFEQSQAQATRERKVGEIGSALITATDIESVLNMAARTFNEALGAVTTRVTLEPSRFADIERELPANGSPANGSATNGNHANGAGTDHNGHDPERNGKRP